MDFDKKGILARAKEAQSSTVVMDEGLRAYMLKVYNYMATGILLTGIIALLSFKMSVVTDASGAITGFTNIGNALFFSGLKWIVMLAPLGIVFYMSFGINKMSASKAQTVFWVFAALMGLSLSWILLVYTGVSVARVFFITSATFGAMSLYGYTTKRDLTKLGSFLMMGLIGIIIASIVNIFMKSSMMYFVISILGVLIFVGLTAYDTQKIKNMYVVSDSGLLAIWIQDGNFSDIYAQLIDWDGNTLWESGGIPISEADNDQVNVSFAIRSFLSIFKIASMVLIL